MSSVDSDSESEAPASVRAASPTSPLGASGPSFATGGPPLEKSITTPAMGHEARPRRPKISIDQTPKSDPTGANTRTPSRGVARFRASVHKVLHMHRTSSFMGANNIGAGAEPGVDPRKAAAAAQYGHIQEKCLIEVMDYSSTRSNTRQMGNQGFVNWLQDPDAHAPEPWVKVRWINIGGISWDVLSQLALNYELHPLALESVLAKNLHARSRADYYVKHLFIHILSHTVPSTDDEDIITNTIELAGNTPPRAESPTAMTLEEYKHQPASAGGERRREETILSPTGSRRSNQAPRRQEDLPDKLKHSRTINEMTIQKLKSDDRVEVDVKPLFLFLTRDNVIISIHSTPNLVFSSPIMSRLQQRDTGLRMTADPSLLVESMIDLVVDQSLLVVESFQKRVTELEREVLLHVKLRTMRSLHILSGDCILLKRTLDPIKSLIAGLRRYDVDRCTALIDPAKVAAGEKVRGYMSSKAKIYLADVYDHIEFALTSLDQTAGTTESLISYTFNQSSYDTNQVMRRLTLITVCLLPLTFLTGYCGMNFMPFAVDDRDSDAVFWYIAIPMMAIIAPLFLYQDMLDTYRYLTKRHLASHIGKALL